MRLFSNSIISGLPNFICSERSSKAELYAQDISKFFERNRGADKNDFKFKYGVNIEYCRRL